MKRWLVIILLLVYVLIGGRLIFLVVMKKDYYTARLNLENNFIIEGMSAPRGRILDVNGHILVDNLGVKSIIYHKLNLSIKEELEVASILASKFKFNFKPSDTQILEYYYQSNKKLIDSRLTKEDLKAYQERRISTNELMVKKYALITEDEIKTVNPQAAYIYYLMNNGYTYQDKIIKTNLRDEEYILVNSLNLPGIRTDITWERTYPYGKTLRDILGMVSSYEQGLTQELKDEYLKAGYALNDRVGISNLEYLYDEYLRGIKAQYLVHNNQLTMIREYQKGKDLVLALDIELQLKVEKILEAEMKLAKKAPNSKYFDQSYIVISNPQDGRILALVGKKIKKDGDFIDYANYTILNSYTVGSVVKGATISVGYKNGLISDKTRVNDGCIKLINQKPKCSWSSLGMLNDIRALAWSSNYWQYMIAVKLTGNKISSNIKLGVRQEHFNEYRTVLADYGLGSLTGIDLLNESPGQKGKIISDDLLLNLAVGQYDAYTPVQLAQYINTIATGKRLRLYLVKTILNNDGSVFAEYGPEVLNMAPVNDQALKRIRLGLKAVNESGTASHYTNRQFTSAGKTGTAESFLDYNLDGMVDTLTTTTSYVMYAPFNQPEYSIAMISPHIGYNNHGNTYKYPLNARVVYKISPLILH